jgi:hypothetical protein
MRASEFITENEMHEWHKQGIPGMKSMDGIGQYYELYRFGIAMAAAGNPDYPFKGDAAGETEDNPTTVSYTDADEEIINGGLARLGKTARQVTSRLSKEPRDTNIQSPVQPRGPVKRSVS